MKTFGGRQFWGDVLHFRQWRIQKNVFTGHYRLLDGEDRRHASGSLVKCRRKLEAIKADQKLAPMSGRAVILVHGIIRSSHSFSEMHKALEGEGYAVFGFDYPSTRVSIADAAEYLHQVVKSLNGIEQIDFVVHSMGGLVVRAYLAKHRDKRIQRMVMLAVPNQGAHLADKLRGNLLYRALLGPAGQQLVSARGGVIDSLPVPDFEFAVIAGAKGNKRGFNPLIPGDDDGTVAVASTRLPGAADYLAIRGLHSFLMRKPEVIAATVRFLKTGRLRTSGSTHPIRPPGVPKPGGKPPR